MQFTVAAVATALFSTIALAAPAAEHGWKPQTVTVQLANEQSGAWANVVVPIDGVSRPVQELWSNTAIAAEHHGLVFASSAQLTAFQQTTHCTITEESHNVDAKLDAEHTYHAFGGAPVELCAALITCHCEGEGAPAHP
ncbi:hypothetical protein N7539_004801 [Penicillium diatomitis]|uniref:Uncharacterized protein n=1 Tax=Penicillium diatomitis TaxID=2819901 RepID=A0A9X0BU58_9EURO|nr:uncharacterized protein N7539_004801 [Penicillium diatomitis]KAJ5484813.1 hypothetical protein N7539_004801 [Penicillium diatomitis]